MTETIYQQIREHLHTLGMAATAENDSPPPSRQPSATSRPTASFSPDCLNTKCRRLRRNASRAGCGSHSSPPARPSASSTGPPNPAWVAG
jgi:hypothetical protein